MKEFRTYDHWLESPYHREPVPDDDRDDELYERKRDEEVLTECES